MYIETWAGKYEILKCVDFHIHYIHHLICVIIDD